MFSGVLENIQRKKFDAGETGVREQQGILYIKISSFHAAILEPHSMDKMIFYKLWSKIHNFPKEASKINK